MARKKGDGPARTVGLFADGHHFAPKVHEAFNVQHLHTFRPATRS